MVKKWEQLLGFFKKHDLIAVLLVLLANLLFRSINLTKNNLWFDEQFSLFWSQLPTADDVKRVSDWDVVPPGFNLIVHNWIGLFGISEFSIRFLSCLAMSLAGCFVYFISKRTFGFRTAVIASVLFLINTNLFYYSQESRSYACQLFLVCISSYMMLLLMKERKWYMSVIYVIVLGAVNYYLFYTHFATLFFFMGQFIFAAIYFRNNLLNWYLISGLVFIYLLLPFLPRVLSLIQSNGQNFWLAKPTWDDLMLFLEEYFNTSYLGVLLALLLLAGLFFFLKSYRSLKQKPYPELIYFVLTGFGLIVFSYVESMLKTPLFLKRYVLIANVGVIISVSYLISQIPLSKKIVIPVLCLILLVGLFTVEYNTYKGWDYKKQMAKVKELKTQNTAVVTDNELSFYYYDVELFKHVSNLGDVLSKQDIYIAYDTTMYNKLDLSKYNRVIVCATWKNTNDILKPTIIRQYPKTQDFLYENNNCKTHLYER